MSTRAPKLHYRQHGFTLIELLVAILLASIIGAGAFHFYMRQNNNMLTQENISDMQQNLRASMDDIIHQAKNAGANLPTGLPVFISGNSNPDTLQLNYVKIGGSVAVADHTPATKANPIHFSIGTDLSQFNVGDGAYLWHQSTKICEPFTVTAINTTGVGGWYEIRHDNGNFVSGPLPGDKVLELNSVRYYVDKSDTTHPSLVKAINGAAPQLFADNIEDFQVRYIRSKLDTVDALGANDTVYVVMVSLSALTNDDDYEASRLGQQGRRHRSLSSAVVVRNNRF